MQHKNIYKLISYFNANHLFYSSINALNMTSTILPISNFLAFKAGKSMNSRNLSQGLWYKKQFCLVLAGSFRWWCRTNCILKAFSTLCYTIFVFKIYLRVTYIALRTCIHISNVLQNQVWGCGAPINWPHLHQKSKLILWSSLLMEYTWKN